MSDQAAVAGDEPAFNPFSPEFVRDPYPSFHRLRTQQPMYRWMPDVWVASRYDDIAQIMKDRRFGKGFVTRTKQRYGEQAFDEPIFASMRHWMLVQDPPDHTRLRGLVAKAFTARQVESWRPRIRALVGELLDRVEGRGEMDFIRDFAYPLPVNVICDILGIPPEDRRHFTERTAVSGRVIDPTPLSRQELDATNAGFLEQVAYFRTLFERRRKQPGDDLTTLLVQVEEAGDRLSEEELIGNVFLLFGAGHETTVNLLGNGMLALLGDPAQWEKLKADPELVPGAVEEMLRFDSSVQMTGRVALQDIEVGGVQVAAGETIICLLGAANRDPEAFDDPDAFEVDRTDVKPVSFGGGIHFCLGAQLARIEADEAFRALIARLPNLKLADPKTIERRPTFTLRGVTSLPVTWS